MLNKNKALRNIIICIIIALMFVLTPIFIRTLPQIEHTWILVYVAIIQAFGLLLSLSMAIRQFSDSKEITRASFIADLNKSFVTNKDYTEMYDMLQNCLDEVCENSISCHENPECTLNIPKSTVSNYLTFFETVYILYRRKAITLEILDDLFAYRFFLAVHSRYIQEQKLIHQPKNFKNIFLLEKEWLKYRVDCCKLTSEELKNACSKVMTLKETGGDVYCTRTLEAAMKENGEEYELLYKELTKKH